MELTEDDIYSARAHGYLKGKVAAERWAQFEINDLQAQVERLTVALELGLPLVELYAKQLEPSIEAILVGWVHGARAALGASKEKNK